MNKTVKNVKGIKMIKVFDMEVKAKQFAQSVKGKVVVHYDWDSMTNKIVREYVVKY